MMPDAGGSMDKIAVDIHVIEGRPQGSQTNLINLLRAMDSLGQASRFALYCHDVDLCRSRIGDGDFEYVQIEPAGSFKRLLWALPRALRRTGARKTYWQYISSPFFFGENHVAILDVLPFTHPHLFPLGFRLRCQVLFFLSMLTATRITTISEYSRREIGRLFPFLRHKVDMVLNGPSFPIETYFAARAETGLRERPYVLAVGRIERRKNVVMLARAFAAAGLDDVDLLIVGSRDLNYAEPLPDAANIIQLEGVSDADLIELYRGASLFVFPSIAEGFGIPLLDAVLFGVPTIASKLTAMEEVGTGVAQLFDPTVPGAQAELTHAIAGHFGSRPIPAATLEQRKLHADRFNWVTSAQSLLRSLEGTTRRGDTLAASDAPVSGRETQ